MECAHCGHDHVNPDTGQMDIDNCWGVDDWGDPCICQDFDW